LAKIPPIKLSVIEREAFYREGKQRCGQEGIATGVSDKMGRV